MIKADLIDRIATETGLTRKQSQHALDSLRETLIQALRQDQKVSLYRFGTFEPVIHAARAARNINKGHLITIPAQKSTRFVVSKTVRRLFRES